MAETKERRRQCLSSAAPLGLDGALAGTMGGACSLLSIPPFGAVMEILLTGEPKMIKIIT